MTPDEFKAAFPEFADIATAVVQRHLDTAAGFVGATAWGNVYLNALGYWVAHYIAMECKRLQTGITAKAGDVTSASTPEGSVSRSDAAVKAAIADPMLKTEYGQMFRMLEKKHLNIPLMVSSTGRGYTSRGQPTALAPGDWDLPIRRNPGDGFTGD